MMNLTRVLYIYACVCVRWVEARSKHRPLSYITKKREFWSLELEVNESTLIPRPETELVRVAFDLLFPQKLFSSHSNC
jgi:methylase of polypeptide subunit release factors